SFTAMTPNRLDCLALALLLFSTSEVFCSAAQQFVFAAPDVAVFCGGEDVVEMQRNGYLETLLTLNCTEKNVRFRNLGWEGDTVYEQPRELNFGSWSNQFRRVGATVIFVQFGQSESLQGMDAVPRFTEAYLKLLDEFSMQTKRLVLLSPTPWESGPALLPDLSARNNALKRYVNA